MVASFRSSNQALKIIYIYIYIYIYILVSLYKVQSFDSSGAFFSQRYSL